MSLMLIEWMLGSFGRYLLELYQSDFFWINLVVVVYAVLLVVAHNNLRKSVLAFERLAKSLQNQNQNRERNSEFETTFKQAACEWKKLYQGEKLLIASPKDFWFETVQKSDLPDLLFLSPDYLKVAAEIGLGKQASKEVQPHIFIAWEEYRYNLLRGRRSILKDPQVIKRKMAEQYRSAKGKQRK